MRNVHAFWCTADNKDIRVDHECETYRAIRRDTNESIRELEEGEGQRMWEGLGPRLGIQLHVERLKATDEHNLAACRAAAAAR